ncbi:MAG TPA: chromosome segregation protein SMC [Anaerolineae bacterium]|nr:chromosome segregation protein SMC [Anaerolineae bacterium]
MKTPLKTISIKGYKSIRELDNFPLTSLNILIGANGSGKTNFISAFKLINQIVEENLQVFISQQGGADNLLYFGRKTTESLQIDLEFGNNGYSCNLLSATGDTLIFESEGISFHDKSRFPQPYYEGLGGGHRETRLLEISRGIQHMTIADHVLHALQSWRVYHFHDTSAGAKVKQSGNLNDNSVLRSDAANLAAFLYLLRETKEPFYRKIISTIRLVAPFFDDFNLRPNPLNPETIQLEWREIGSDAYFNANVLSDGTLRFMCLATLLLQPELPSTILIDEPELGLHPYAITVLASLLRSAAKETQVIVSTQSVPLVNQFSPEDIVVVDRLNQQSTFRRLNENELEDWIEDYGLGDLWEKNVIGGRPR